MILAVFEVVSRFPFTPGLDLPAERGLSGKVVLRFGGVSCGKSGRLIGCGGGRRRGLGELGLEVDPTLRPFEDNPRPPEGKAGVDGEREGVRLLRVGVEGLEGGRIVGEVKFPGVCGRELGVEGLVFWEGLVGLSLEVVVVVVGDGRVLEGVEARDGVVRVDGVESLAVEEERLVGVDGLM